MTFTAGLALALTAILTGGNATPVAQAQTQALTQPMPKAQTVQQYVETYFADEPVMIAIAGCESNFRQYDTNGTILKNDHSSAKGIFQIMTSIHAARAADLGLDIYTMQGNAAYAKYLFDQSGTVPWNASKACWGKTQAGGKDLAINSK
jgi:hypothetical protein